MQYNKLLKLFQNVYMINPYSTIEHLLPLFLTQLKDEVKCFVLYSNIYTI